MTIASIPSPGFNAISLGPLDLNFYGLVIGIAIVAGVKLAGHRLAKQGLSPEIASTLVLWVAPAGLIGARLAHLATDWRRYEGRWLDAFKVWEGGLGIIGAIVVGTAVGLWKVRQLGLPTAVVLDAAIPAVALGQAIGRWGNWFNQELFGRPTTLPWGLEIDAAHTPSGFEPGTLFHPTFLYESLWNLAVLGLLLWVSATNKLRTGRLIIVYLAAYAAGRLAVESLRIDNVPELLGVRINFWVYVPVLVVSVGLGLVELRRGPDRATEASVPSS